MPQRARQRQSAVFAAARLRTVANPAPQTDVSNAG